MSRTARPSRLYFAQVTLQLLPEDEMKGIFGGRIAIYRLLVPGLSSQCHLRHFT